MYCGVTIFNKRKLVTMNFKVQINYFTDWFPGWRKHASQPNDDGTSGQDCVEVRRAMPPRPAHPTFLWNDRSCREHNYFVCERPGPNGKFMKADFLLLLRYTINFHGTNLFVTS